jgi:superfamily II DNA or RNA helicase
MLQEFANDPHPPGREVGIILPVGCGKSGCICIAPFAFRSARTLVVAPGVTIATQLHDDFDVSNPEMFYKKSRTLTEGPHPELVEIRGTTTNRSDLDEAHVVVTNIQQLQGESNRWLSDLPDDYFDLILVDEGHHNVAASWDLLRKKFPKARIVNFSATPLRADGQLMAGQVLYSYPVFRAIEEGYVKRLKAVVLNPRTLRYVRREGDREIEVDLDEVRRLGETDAAFRRSVLSSPESLNTIVDASIRELQKLRKTTGENRLKIIASALHRDHCRQVVEAYRAKGLKADYVHALEDKAANKKVQQRLENHELDVIVQVRKLGEGFDHKYLAVAAVLNVFSNLSPFVQFAGRIMRVVVQNAPGHPLNHGVVVFHAGANVAKRWKDFQEYSQADQEYFDQLLPLEGLDFASAEEIEIEPVTTTEHYRDLPAVRAQSGLQLEEIPLIEDPDALAALRLLKERGYTSAEISTAYDTLEPVPMSKVRQRQAKRLGLDMRVKTEAARILGQRKINPEGRELDRKHLGKSNLIVLKSAIDSVIKKAVGGKSRSELSQAELDMIDAKFREFVDEAVRESFS